MPSAYSPFDKPLRGVETSDLERLRTVSEGWFVDYKEQEISGKDLAKAVSAFANTYGGWFFIGIAQKSREEPVAGKFPGIARSDVDPLLQRLRQAVNSHMSPAAHFDTRVLWGPDENLGLADDRAVICVQIPMSFVTPHVHSDGRIFRRVSDSSEPKPEKDRHLLDVLWGRKKEAEAGVKEWIERRPEFSDAEKGVPFVRLLICSDPWGERDPWFEGSLHEVRKVLGAKDAKYAPSLPFDTVHATAKGFIARQVMGNDPTRLGLTWTFRRDLSGEVLIPLNCFSLDDLRMVSYHLAGYDYAKRFQAILTKSAFKHVRFVDLNALFYVLSGVAAHHRHLLEAAGAERSFFVKIQLLNCWRTVPFLDAKYALDSFEEHGVPVCLSAEITVPADADPDSFAQISDPMPDLGSDVAAITQAYVMLTWVSRAMGLPLDISTDPDAPVYPDVLELREAAERSMVSQKLRNERKG